MRAVKGRITREQTVWCWSILNTETELARLLKEYRNFDECSQHHQEAGPVAGVARRAGWRRIEPLYGWMCPQCSDALGRIPAGRLLGLLEDAD